MMDHVGPVPGPRYMVRAGHAGDEGLLDHGRVHGVGGGGAHLGRLLQQGRSRHVGRPGDRAHILAIVEIIVARLV